MRINGQPGDTVAAADRGLHYGDGLFETLAVIGGQPCLWHSHLDRLESGCRRLAIPLPERDALLRDCREEIGDRTQGVLKILITRGEGGRGYRPPPHSTPTRVVGLFPWPDYPAQWAEAGVWLRICRTRLGSNPALAGIKHLNRLEQVMARAEWHDPAIAEGLMLDDADRVVEGTMTNLFVLCDGALCTPSLHRCGVAGVLRALVMELAAGEGLAVREVDLALDDLRRAEALFLTNSLIPVWPVRRLETTDYASSERLRPLWRAVRARAFAGGVAGA